MRMITPALCLFLVAPLVSIGCGKSEPKKDPDPATQPTAAKDAAKQPASTGTTDAGLREHMQKHFESIRTIERAIVVGDIETAQKQSQWLAEHAAATKVAEYAEENEAVRAAAAALAKEEKLEDMAHGAAKLASLCGHCHLVTTSITSFEWSEPPAAEGSAKDRMQRHLWAMDRLWEGLVGPSEISWQEGSKVLQTNPFPVDALPIDKESQPEAEERLATLAALAKEAGAATDLADRSKVYGELLGTCSGCHSKLR